MPTTVRRTPPSRPRDDPALALESRTMRIAKPLLMISLSVFLLAVSWSLLTGEAPVGEATAQTEAPLYDGPPLVYFKIEGGSAWAVDEDGYAWIRPNLEFAHIASPWDRRSQIFVPGTPIPTGSESMGSFKSTHRSSGN
jgi:hypothetical protein